MRLRCGCGGVTWSLLAYAATCSGVIGPDGAKITSGTFVARTKFKRALIRPYAALRASNYTVEFRCERRQVVDFEMLAFGPEPR